MRTIGMWVAVAGLVLGGCATTGEYSMAGRQAVKNEQGHLIGYKELLRDKESGEVIARVNLFTPVRDDAGEVIGYEEETRGGAVIRDLQGRQIGNRFSDLRSRNTNMRSRGITIVIGSLDTRRAVAKDRPKAHDILASLDANDLSAIR